jgi:hypothetical protein
VGKPQLAELLTLVDEGGNRVVFDVSAVGKIDLEDRAAVSCKRNDGAVGQLVAAIELELFVPQLVTVLEAAVALCPYPFDIAAVPRDVLKRVVCDFAAIGNIEPL